MLTIASLPDETLSFRYAALILASWDPPEITSQSDPHIRSRTDVRQSRSRVTSRRSGYR